MTFPVLELDLREALGETPAVACEHPRCRAQGEAANWRWLPWCGCRYLMGDACREGTLQFLAQDVEIMAYCENCQARYSGMCCDVGRVVPFG